MKNRVLMAYLPHMLRDFLMTRGGAMLIISFVFIGPLLVAYSTTDMTPEQMRGQVLQVSLTVTTFLALIATYGMIGQDFRLGYFRSLFAKPVSVPLYYLALFGCAVVGFWLVQGIVLLALAGFGVNGWDRAVALESTVRFVLLGGMTFAFSKVSRLDWVFSIFLISLAGPLRSAYPAVDSLRGKLINVSFPPMHLFDLSSGARASGQMSALVAPGGVEWTSLAWIVGYAVVCVMIALFLTRRIPLASGQ